MESLKRIYAWTDLTSRAEFKYHDNAIIQAVIPEPIRRHLSPILLLIATLLFSSIHTGLFSFISTLLSFVYITVPRVAAVPIFNLMEDAATAEISRAQVWQWIRHPRGLLDDGRKVTRELFRRVLDEELAKVRRFASDRFDVARELFDQITTDDEFVEFLTLPGYEKLG